MQVKVGAHTGASIDPDYACARNDMMSVDEKPELTGDDPVEPPEKVGDYFKSLFARYAKQGLHFDPDPESGAILSSRVEAGSEANTPARAQDMPQPPRDGRGQED